MIIVYSVGFNWIKQQAEENYQSYKTAIVLVHQNVFWHFLNVL